MGSLGLITARISKTRVPIKTDRTQYGGLGAATESGNAPNMKINRPLTPNPISLVLPPPKRGGEDEGDGGGGCPATDPRRARDKHTGSPRGLQVEEGRRGVGEEKIK